MWAALHRPWEGWSRYVQRRALRIYPLWWAAHIVFLVGFVALALVVGQGRVPMSPTDPEFYLSFVGIRFLPSTFYYGVPAWWYIGLAIQLYVLFPFLARALRRVGPGRFLVAAVAVGTVARLAGLLTFDAYLDAWSRGAIFITRLPEFAFGMALAAWFAADEKGTARFLKMPAILATAIVTYAVATLLSLTLVGNAISPFLLGVSAFVLLFAVFEWMGGRDGPQWVSGHSYSIYLTHVPFITAAILVATVLGLTALLTGIGIAAGVVLAVAAALFLERSTSVFSSARRRFGTRQTVAGIIGVAVIAGAGLVAAELIVETVAPQEVRGWGEKPSLEPSDEVGWRLKPNSNTNLRWVGYDYEVAANAMGYPGPAPHGGAEATRIVAIGDAFTSAEGVDTQQAWPRVLERALGGVGGGYEVVNLAVTGYGPEQYAAAAEQHLEDLAPDVVLVGFFVNDFTDVDLSMEDFQDSIGFGRGDPFGPSATLQLAHLREWIRHLVVWPAVETLLGRPNPHGYTLGNFAALERGAIDPDRMAAVETYLERIVTIADDLGAETHLVLIPAPVEICGPDELSYYPKGVDLAHDDYDVDGPRRAAHELAGSLGVAVTDLRPMLGAFDVCPYFDFNMHWKATTHEAVGSYLAEVVANRN